MIEIYFSKSVSLSQKHTYYSGIISGSFKGLWYHWSESLIRKIGKIRNTLAVLSCGYLSGRKQFISYNHGIKSSLHDVLCGIPQGSILGSLLFFIYINDLPCVLKFASTILFADDANLYASHKNLKTLFSEMNKDIENLVTWFKANILFLNICKTFYMVFSTTGITQDLNIAINGNKV